jgi:hypothetical protein
VVRLILRIEQSVSAHAEARDKVRQGYLACVSLFAKHAFAKKSRP